MARKVIKKGRKRPQRPAQEPLVDPTATDNLVGFFALLLEIDQRNNPQFYKSPAPTAK